MRRSDFSYELPPELIAQEPLPERRASRLLHLSARRGRIEDLGFGDLPALLRAGDLLVLNDTRVIPARLYGRKSSGGRVEVLVERVLDERSILAHVRASRAPRPGSTLALDGGVQAEVTARRDALFELRLPPGRPASRVLEAYGHVPLPPYIRRPDRPADRERYQTVFARRGEAVAAPTAGLHFDRAMLESLAAAGVELGYLTLHVGAGTFEPVRAERIEDHRLHAERFAVSGGLCEQVRAARRRGGRVVAVGTTTVRALEAAAPSGEIAPCSGETRLFISPGFEFRVVDAMLTNFHLPESSLLMLVCAFGGYGPVMRAYRHAVAQRYRFFSYGDAMFIDKG